MKNLILFLIFTMDTTAFASEADCSQIYGANTKCKQVACSERQKEFIGTWSGAFQSYSQELSTKAQNIYRPFQNSVSYSENGCLKNLDNGDVFIVGHRIDTYPPFQSLPAATQSGLLITGTHADGSPFLKTVDDNGNNDYQLVYRNTTASLAIWTLTIPAREGSPEMRFTTIDGRDFTETAHNKRNVVVTMSIGPTNAPFWEAVVSSGSHTLQP
jgi:hypothetical protein